MTTFDLEWSRRCFPGLASDWVTFDSAGGSQILGACVDRISDFLTTTNVQLGASYPMSVRAAEGVAAGRAAAGELFGAGADDVALGSSSTELLQRLALALGGPGATAIRPGDEIVVTDVDHETNIGPWRRLAALGVVVKTWPVRTETWRLELDDLRPLLTDRTRLVCFTHASNVLGAVHPVEEYAAFIHEHGAMVCVDGVAFAPHAPVNAPAWDVDFYAMSFYKVYGPHLAGLYVRPDRRDLLTSMNHDFLGNAFPGALEPGNVSYELASSLAAIPDYVRALSGAPDTEDALRRGWAAIGAQEEALQTRFIEELTSIPDVQLIGPAETSHVRRAPTVSFVVDGLDSSALPPRLERDHVAVRYGHFYAKRLIDRLGLAERNGVVRASFLHYHTPDEIERTLRAIRRAIADAR